MGSLRDVKQMSALHQRQNNQTPYRSLSRWTSQDAAAPAPQIGAHVERNTPFVGVRVTDENTHNAQHDRKVRKNNQAKVTY